MRKKSHISLSRYLLEDLESRVTDLKQHRTGFYIGSILPDLTPSFVYRRHSFDDSYKIVEKKITKLAKDVEKHTEHRIRFWIRLGVVMHYLADYCTYPHNSCYDGNITEHCQYERDLKYTLRAYVRSEIPDVFCYADCDSVSKEVRHIIRKLHQKYLADTKQIERDCEYSVTMCRSVLNALFRNQYEVEFES